MRLRRLDLSRYGKFTDRSIDFGVPAPGSPDFHIVYGPNEAGKSTLFSAFLDLLFGIERLSSYGFLHPYPTMRVGGVVEVAGREHAVFRVKRNQNSLIGSDEQPLPDNLFSAGLGSIDRATYQMMFSLDDDSIERGGESILKSEGELGTLLFSASSGLSDASSVLGRLKAEAEAFYKPQGRKHRLSELKADLDRLKDEKAAIDVNAREYANLRKELSAAVDRHEVAVRARAESGVALEKAKAQMDALPVLGRLRGLRMQLAGFGDLPEPPSAWASRLPELQREETDVNARIAQLDGTIERGATEIAAQGRDPVVLAVADDLAHLDQSGLEARYRSAAADLPVRDGEMARLSADIAAQLIRLGRGDEAEPIKLLLPAQAIGRIRELMEMHSILTERVSAAAREHETAGEAKRQAAVAFDGLPDLPIETDVAGLAGVVKALQQDDCILRQQTARRQIVAAEAELSEKLSTLLPVRIDGDALSRLAVPTEADITDWTERRTTIGENLKRLAERIAEEDQLVAVEAARLAEVTRSGDFTDDAEALALRNARNDAWRQHRQTLDAASADVFERTLSSDDESTRLRFVRSQELAQARALSLSVAERGGKLESWNRQRQQHETALNALRLEISAAADACGLPCETKLNALTAWLGRRTVALDVRERLRLLKIELQVAASDEQRGRDRLLAAMSAAGIPHEVPQALQDAVALAERFVAERQQANGGRKSAADALDRATETLKVREAARHAAEAELMQWSAAWSDALGPTWLTLGPDVLPPSDVRPVLGVLQELDKLLQAQANLEHRITGMRHDQAAFDKAVGTIADRLAMQKGDVLSDFRQARDRLAAAQRQEAFLGRLVEEQEAREADRRRLVEARERLDIEKTEMLDTFGCSTLLEVAGHVDRVRERSRLRERIVEVEDDLASRLSVGDANAAELALSAVDEQGLRLEAAELQARWEEHDRDASECHAQRRAAERALDTVGGGDAAAHLDERRSTVLVEIEERAIAYLKLKAGIAAAEQGLRLYRERHRSAMMQRASAAFNVISGGEYAGLSTQADSGKEYLIANSASGASKLAEDLSKGTRFQLYLALRIAGYHEIAATREALPFIADDIMETFDDGRAYHAFRLMAEMAGAGQVIYLTHHEHLCEIAQKASPEVKIHRL